MFVILIEGINATGNTHIGSFLLDLPISYKYTQPPNMNWFWLMRTTLIVIILIITVTIIIIIILVTRIFISPFGNTQTNQLSSMYEIQPFSKGKFIGCILI